MPKPATDAQDALLPDSELGPEKRDVTYNFKSSRSQFMDMAAIPKNGDILKGPRAMDYVVTSVIRRRNLEAPGRVVIVINLEPGTG